MSEGLLVGEYITDFFSIYQITAVKQRVGIKGKEETCIYHEPVQGSDKRFTASIPIGNLKKAGIRKLLSKEEIEQIIGDLKNLVVESEYNTITAKEEVYQNEPRRIVSVLIYFWGKIGTLGKADKDLTEQIMEHLCREIAMVTKKKYGEVKKNMVMILNRRNRVSEKIEN